MANTTKNVLIIGGDRRNVYLFERIKGLDQVELHAFGLALADISHSGIEEATRRADVLILPMPSEKNGMIPLLTMESAYPLETLLSNARPGATLVGGFLHDMPRAEGIACINLLECEQFKQANAWPTAEGAIRIALERTERTLNASKCAVLGYGRVGRDVVKLLGSFGAKVAATSRQQEQLRRIADLGVQAVHTDHLLEACADSNFIFNTIPHVLLDEAALRQLRRDVVIIDLASVPYGVDFNAAAKLKLDAQPYQSLPGRMFPKTAADIIYDCIEYLFH